MKTYTHFILLFIALFYSCKTPYEATSNTASQYKIENTASDTVSSIEKLLRPYRDSLDKTMNEVIGYAEGDFSKQRPSSSLGNLVVDAIYQRAIELYPNTDNAIYNYGGIRIPELKSGNITVGKIFELIPFENELVIMEVPGSILKEWGNLMIKNFGWPVYNQVPFMKSNLNRESKYIDTTFWTYPKEVAVIITSAVPIKNDSTYLIATNDYIANGGDDCSFLKECKRYNTGILIRDIIISFIKKKKTIIPVTKIKKHDSNDF